MRLLIDEYHDVQLVGRRGEILFKDPGVGQPGFIIAVEKMSTIWNLWFDGDDEFRFLSLRTTWSDNEVGCGVSGEFKTYGDEAKDVREQLRELLSL